MTRTRLFPGLAALLAVVLTTASARADEPKPPTPEERLKEIDRKLDSALATLKQIDTLRKDVDALSRAMDSLKTDQGLKLQVAVEDFNDKIKALERSCMRQFGTVSKDVEDLKRDIEAINKEIGFLRTPTGGSTDKSRYPPNPTAGTGVLRFVNSHNRAVIVFVKGEPHPLPAGDKLELKDLPVGPVTFEVLGEGFGSLGPRTREVVADHPLTITITPPQ